MGFKKISELWTDQSCIPDAKGVYLVLTPTPNQPAFLDTGVGGFFKGKNPNVKLEMLTNNWVGNAQVIYIGKATSLRKRLKQYLRFGQTKNVGHWGGRYIWQLENHMDLIFCWRTTSDQVPSVVEQELIDIFRKQFKERPFANLTG